MARQKPSQLKKKLPQKTTDAVILDVLRYEFPCNEHATSERKIKGRLRYYGLGPYQQERVNLLRRLKDEVQDEIHRYQESRYYLGSHGPYAAMEDFDVEQMIEDFARSFPDVPREEITAFIPFAVYLYYLR